MTQRKTAIVVGGGLIGCCSAYYLARAGLAVTLLERDQIGSGASSGNCGFVCPSHLMPMAAPGVIGHTLRQMFSPDGAVSFRLPAVPRMLPWLCGFVGRCRLRPMFASAQGRHALLASSMKLYRELLTQPEFDCEWQDRGLLVAYRSERKFDAFSETASRLKQEFGVVATRCAGAELRDLEPALKPEIAGAWQFPADAHVRPEKLLSALRTALHELRVDIKEHVEVLQLKIADGRLRTLKTTCGDLDSDVVIMSTGAEATRFARPLKCRIPIQPGKGYSLTMPTWPHAPMMPIIFDEHHVAVTPFEGALRIGSTMEFAGYDRSINPSRVRLLMKSARAHLIEVPADHTPTPWVGWRPMTYDGLPRIDHAPAAHNVIVAAGNGMIGLATAPATGKLVAELALGTPPHIDPSPYSLKK